MNFKIYKYKLLDFKWLIYTYFLIIFILSISPNNLSSYDSFFLCSLFFICFLVRFSIQYIFNIFIILFLFININYFTHSNFLYCLLELITTLFIFALIKITKLYTIDVVLLKIIQTGFSLFILVSILSSLGIPELTIEERFIGLFKGTNISASVCSFMLVALWESTDKKKKIFYFFLFSILIYFYIIFKTRTMLFLFPYFIYQLTYFYKKKSLLFACFLFSIFVGLSSLTLLTSSMRLEADSSYNTRSLLYLFYLKEIINNYFVIPHGFNKATLLAKLITGDDAYSVHNDFLRYSYDLGIIFYGFVFYIFRQIKDFLNVERILLLLGYIVLALHNLLFAYQTVIVITIVVQIMIYKYKIKNNLK